MQQQSTKISEGGARIIFYKDTPTAEHFREFKWHSVRIENKSQFQSTCT